MVSGDFRKWSRTDVTDFRCALFFGQVFSRRSRSFKIFSCFQLHRVVCSGRTFVPASSDGTTHRGEKSFKFFKRFVSTFASLVALKIVVFRYNYNSFGQSLDGFFAIVIIVA